MAVLLMASRAKGGIGEWCEMDLEDFLLWIEALKELNKN
jgi:hypothetical protein